MRTCLRNSSPKRSCTGHVHAVLLRVMLCCSLLSSHVDLVNQLVDGGLPLLQLLFILAFECKGFVVDIAPPPHLQGMLTAGCTKNAAHLGVGESAGDIVDEDAALELQCRLDLLSSCTGGTFLLEQRVVLVALLLRCWASSLQQSKIFSNK